MVMPVIRMVMIVGSHLNLLVYQSPLTTTAGGRQDSAGVSRVRRLAVGDHGNLAA